MTDAMGQDSGALTLSKERWLSMTRFESSAPDARVGLQRRRRQYYRVLAGSRQAVDWGWMNRRSWMFEERRLTRRWIAQR